MSELADKTVWEGSPELQSYGCTHVFKIHNMGEVKTFEFSNGKQKLVLGRNEVCDIVVDSPIVSRRHLEINIDNNKCIIKDLGGLNGTFVDRMKIQGYYEIKNGNNISIDNDDMNRNSGVLIEYFKTSSNNVTVEKTLSLAGKNRVVIGRDNECDISIKHTKISRKHVILTLTQNGWIMEDCKSTNGTYLNGSKVDYKVLLKNNDSVFIVNTKITFRQECLTYTIMESGISMDILGVTKDIKNNGKVKRLVNAVNLSIAPGEFVAIVGGSGAGKSTLMDCLNGFRPATSGRVIINGDDFYANYDAYKEIIGYVPQKDIVYDNLTLKEMLFYSAKLRMPKDSRSLEIRARVEKVIKDVMLDGKENIKIRRLSGGQRKRASIAIELLAEPKMLFLDEPTSGLDPGMDKSMMKLLRTLSSQGTTIILITHATTNISLCDKVVFLGVGGRLCYFGPPAQMMEFFGVDDVADIYMRLSVVEGGGNIDEREAEGKLVRVAEHYKTKLDKDPVYSDMRRRIENDSKAVNMDRNKALNKSRDSLRQLRILLRRYFKLIVSDKMSLVLMLGQAPLMVLILKLVGDENSFKTFESSKLVFFTMVCMVALMGILNAFLEVCKEKEIFKREHSTNVGIIPYLLSKIIMLGIVCLFQATVLGFGSKLMIDFPKPESGLFFSINLDYWITLSLGLIAATAMGILISSYATSTERATLLMPIAIVPQIVFSGVLFTLSGFTKVISYVIISKWVMSSLGGVFDINNLRKTPGIAVDSLYKHTTINLLGNWIGLGIFTLACVILSGIILSKNLKQE